MEHFIDYGWKCYRSGIEIAISNLYLNLMVV